MALLLQAAPLRTLMLTLTQTQSVDATAAANLFWISVRCLSAVGFLVARLPLHFSDQSFPVPGIVSFKPHRYEPRSEAQKNFPHFLSNAIGGQTVVSTGYNSTHTQLNMVELYIAVTRHRTTLHVHNSTQHNSTRHSSTRHNSIRYNSTRHNSTRPQLDTAQLNTPQLDTPQFDTSQLDTTQLCTTTTRHTTTLHGHNSTPHNSTQTIWP